MYNTPATRPLFRLLAPLAFGCLVYLLVLLAFDTHSRILEDFFNQELLVCIGMSYLVLEANRLIAVSFLDQQKRFWLKCGLKLLLALLLTLICVSIALILYFRYQLNFTNPLSFLTELRVFNGIFLSIALLYQSYFLGFIWLHQQYQLRIAAEEEQGLELEKEIDQFSYAIHPDFLFAGLENVILKIREAHPQQADDGITLLAELYHYFLRRQEELIPLQDELAVVEKLQRLLFQSGKHLKLQLTLPQQEVLLVPGSLVRLLEAIAQSQLSSEAAPLLIRVQQERESLTISFTPNFSLTHPTTLESTLENLQQRYRWLTGGSLYWTAGHPYQISLPTATLETHESHHH